MDRVVKVAGVQMEPRLLQTDQNLAYCLEMLHLAAGEGAQLVVFPECALSGYVFSSLEEALPAAEPIPGPSTECLVDACRELNVHVVIGLLERDADKCFNAAVLLGPSGLIGKHRKAHLPDVGVDSFVNQGDLPFRVYDTVVGKIGMAICWESCFTEHIRALALQGAEIIILPTNWPDWPLVRAIRDVLVPARAAENYVYLIAVDRVGEEAGVSFMGGSRVAGMGGVILTAVEGYKEGVMYADIDLEETRGGAFVFDQRRPELYGILVEELAQNPKEPG